MANSLKFIKNVNYDDAANNLQVLFQFILGSDMPGKHTVDIAYKEGDFVYSFSNTDGEYHVFMAIKNVPEGIKISNDEYWQRMSIKDLISQGKIALGQSEDIVIISDDQPTQENNNVWLKPIKIKDFNPGVVEKEDINLVFDCEHIVGQDDEPDDPNVKLWFDYEFDHEGKPIPMHLDTIEEDESDIENLNFVGSDADLGFDDFDDF